MAKTQTKPETQTQPEAPLGRWSHIEAMVARAFEGCDETNGPDPVELFEAAIAATVVPPHDRNGELMALVRQFQVQQRAIRELQLRLAKRAIDKRAGAEAGNTKSESA